MTLLLVAIKNLVNQRYQTDPLKPSSTASHPIAPSTLFNHIFNQTSTLSSVYNNNSGWSSLLSAPSVSDNFQLLQQYVTVPYVHNMEQRTMLVDNNNDDSGDLDDATVDPISNRYLSPNQFQSVMLSMNSSQEDQTEGQQSLWSEQMGNAVLVFFYSLIVLVSLFGNTFVCRVMLSLARSSSSRSSITTNILIVNLAVSDLLLTTFNIPVNIARFVVRDWPFGSIICTAMPFIQSLTAHCSAITMMVIALERYRRLIGINLSPKILCLVCVSALRHFLFQILRALCRFLCCWLCCCYCCCRGWWFQVNTEKTVGDSAEGDEDYDYNQCFNEDDNIVDRNNSRHRQHRRSTFCSPPSSTTTSVNGGIAIPIPVASSVTSNASCTTSATAVVLTSVGVNSTSTKTVPGNVTITSLDPNSSFQNKRLSLHHQISIRHHTTQSLDTKGSSIRLVTMIWLCSAMLSIPYGLYNRVKVYPSFIESLRMVRCVADYPSQTVRLALSIMAPVTQYLLPIGLTALFYARIGYFLWRRNDAIGSVSENHRMSILRRKRNRVKMLVMVVLVFALCWLPLHIYVSLIEFHIIQHNFAIYFVTHWIAMSSVCYNPFIYCWLNETFRRKTKSLFRMVSRWRNHVRNWFGPCCGVDSDNSINQPTNSPNNSKDNHGELSPSGGANDGNNKMMTTTIITNCCTVGGGSNNSSSTNSSATTTTTITTTTTTTVPTSITILPASPSRSISPPESPTFVTMETTTTANDD